LKIKKTNSQLPGAIQLVDENLQNFQKYEEKSFDFFKKFFRLYEISKNCAVFFFLVF